MENYRNTSFVAQEGCPSLDFTLLDRPSSSTVSAPGSTAPLFSGENLISSFDFVDATGVESHIDRSFPGHRSMPEAENDALSRNVSMQPGPFQRQGIGEHNFFGQENEDYRGRLGNGDGYVQSQNILLGGANPEQLGAKNMCMEYTPGGKIQSSPSGTTNRNMGSLSPTIHVAHPLAGAFGDGRRNQVASTQQYPNDSQNPSSKFSNFLPVSIGMHEQQTNANNMANASGQHYQSQIFRYASQNPSGPSANETFSSTFPTNLLPSAPVPGPPEARPEGPTRGFGMTELQVLRQQALQSKQQQQALQFKQQQAMRLQQQQEAMRVQQEEAARQQQEVMKMQQEAAMKAQKLEVLRMQQQQEALRLQQQEVMQSQQQDAYRMQQQAVYLQQQGAARTEERNAMLWSQQQDVMLSKHQDTDLFQQQQALWSQQQKAAVWGQQDSEQKKSLQSQQQQRGWQTQQQQQPFMSHQQQAWSSNQPQPLQIRQGQALQFQQGNALQFQQGQALHFQQPSSFHNHQQMLASQQEHPVCFQQQTLQIQQQQAPHSQQVMSQETSAEFLGTSYSALLHGPDTPPSNQSGGDALFSDMENTTVAFPPVNTHAITWPNYGSSTYQGLPREPSMGQNLVESQNLQPHLHPRDDHNLTLAEDQGRQSFQSEYPVVGSRAPSPVKPALEMGGFGSLGISAFQISQSLGGQPVRHNGMSNSPVQTNLLSQSQQHFQGLQLSQQRSWECLVQKHGVSKPSFPEVAPSLSQAMLTFERSTGAQQNLSSIGTGRKSLGHDSQQLGSMNPDTENGFKRRQMFTNAVGGVATMNMDEEERQCFNSSSEIRPLQIGQDAGYQIRHGFGTKDDTWGNRVAQLSKAIVQVPAHSVSPSNSTSQAMRNINQQTRLDMQVPPTITTGRNSMSSQENFVWKEHDISRQTSSYFSEPDGYSQGFWKRRSSCQESVGGLDNTCEPSNRDVNDSTWRHKTNSDAQLNVQASLSVTKSPGGQDNAGQEMHAKQLGGHKGVSQQVHNSSSLNGVGSQPVANTVEAFSQGINTGISKVGQVHRLKSLQGSTVDTHRVMELTVDPSSRRVSLAHLRQSQPSSPLSPQHVKLGLGPANLPQHVQQVGNASTPQSFQMDGSYLQDHGPSFNSDGKKFFARTPQAGSGHESPAGRSELDQGIIASVNDMPLQNNARPSSALSNSSSFSKESADSEALPSASIAHGAEGSGSFQGIMSFKGRSSHGAGTNIGYSEQASSLSLPGKFKASADFSRQSTPSAGDSQGKFTSESRHANMDTKSLRVLQNQQIINVALKQLGNRVQPGNLAGLLTTLKTSLSEHSKNSRDRDESLLGVAESGRLPSGSAQVDGNVSQLMQSPQMILGNPVNPGHVYEDNSLQFKAGNPNALKEYNKNPWFKQEEGSGSGNPSLLSDLQRQDRQSLLMNGSRAHLSQSGEQGAGFSTYRSLNPIPLQVENQGRDSNSQTSVFGQDQHLQQQDLVIEGDPVDRPSEAQSKIKSSLIQGYLSKVSIGQGDGTFMENKDHKSGQPEVSALKFANQCSLQLVSTSNRQLSKQIVNASSSPCTDQGVDVGLATDAQSSHIIRLPSDITNDQVVHSLKPKQKNYSAHGKPENCSQNFLAHESIQPVAHIEPDLHLSAGQGDSDSKVEDARPGVKGHITTSNWLPPCQVSASKTSLPGPSAIHPKKRKKPLPLLIPWYIAATQPRDSLPSTSEMELIWANTANRLCDKDDGDARKGYVVNSIRARRRLRLTTQLMQQLIPPLPAQLMHGNTPVDHECATFSLAKSALEDACRLVTNTRREATSAHDCSENKNMLPRGQQGKTWGMAKRVAVARCVESFMERARGLESELARIETSTPASDLRRDIGDIDKMAIVNRLAKHHGTSFTVNSSELCSVDGSSEVNAGIWKPSPKKYVTAAPMPRTLPGVKCLSL